MSIQSGSLFSTNFLINVIIQCYDLLRAAFVLAFLVSLVGTRCMLPYLWGWFSYLPSYEESPLAYYVEEEPDVSKLDAPSPEIVQSPVQVKLHVIHCPAGSR